MMPRLILAAAALATLAACEMQTPPTDTPEDACGAAALQNLVSQPASVLDTMRFSQPLRVIRPDTAVTMDFRAERLNIAVDEAERISRVYCS